MKHLAAFVEKNVPQLISYGFFLDRDSTQMTVVAVHPTEPSRCRRVVIALYAWAAAQNDPGVLPDVSPARGRSPPPGCAELDALDLPLQLLKP